MFYTHTHTAPQMERTRARTHTLGVLALGQSGLSAAAHRLSLFPCPVCAPCATATLSPCPGAQRSRGSPRPLSGGGGGASRPPSPRLGRSLAIFCRPVPHQIAQQRLPLLRKPPGPSRHRDGAAAVAAASSFKDVSGPFVCPSVCLQLANKKRLMTKTEWDASFSVP